MSVKHLVKLMYYRYSVQNTNSTMRNKQDQDEWIMNEKYVIIAKSEDNLKKMRQKFEGSSTLSDTRKSIRDDIEGH